MKKLIFIALLSIGCSFSLQAQYISLSDDPIMFVEQADSLLKQWGVAGDSAADKFSSLWNELNMTQQEQVVQISKTFRERKYRVNPYFFAFYNSIYQSLNGEYGARESIENYLNVTQKVVENAESGKEVLNYFVVSSNFFKHGAIYYSGFNILAATSGSFNFEYTEAEVIDEVFVPEPIADDVTEEEEDAFEDTADDDGGGWDDAGWDDAGWDDSGSDNWDSFDDNENPDNYDAIADESFDPFISGGSSGGGGEEIPSISGAVINIENADFEFLTPYDTFLIKGTSGTMIIGSRYFIGNGGKMDLSILEYEDATVTLKDYNFDVINPAVAAENVSINFPTFFDKEIEGSFEMKSIQPRPSGPSYPVFRSYDSKNEYKNIGGGVTLTGGFSVIGNNISTQGLDLLPNFLSIEKEGEQKFRGTSNRFYLEDSVLKTHQINMTIYHDGDSLYHPSMGMSYDFENEIINCFWERGVYNNMPMTNSYHKVEILADKLWWDLNTLDVNFGIVTGRTEKPAIVKSIDNFDNQEFHRMKSLYDFNPIQMAYFYYVKNKSKEFSVYELAESFKINPDKMKAAVKFVAGYGYLDYSEVGSLIKINRKTKHTYYSNLDKIDYDNMEWQSISPSGNNITFKLDSGDLVIRGVGREIVSKKLKVFYEPDSGIVVLKRNRDFTFNGKITAGNYNITGKKFNFKYEEFYVNLEQIDSISFDLKSDSTGEIDKRKIMGGDIENTSGVFYLNEPDNKSGKKSLAQYPILDVLEPSFVYFDDKDILKGVYNRDVYFEIPRFKLDTLESDNPSVISVPGTFHSGGVIPEFQTILGVNKDLSLGFEYKVPEDGFITYEDEQAVFFGDISMNKKGLNANGKFEYLTSTTISENVTFYQDSMVIEGGDINVEAADTEYGNYPNATCEDFKSVYVPSNERYILNSKGESLVELYSGVAKLDGAAMISKKGMFGIGELRTKGTITKSDNFKFTKNNFVGREADFIIEANSDQDTVALVAENVKMIFDYTANTARVEPEIEGEASISLPLMYYKTSIPIGVWDLDQRTFTMIKPPEVDIENSYFYSTLDDQDSLAFSGESATYDANTSFLSIYGVPGIYVADAYITPENGSVVIDESALIQPLTNAEIRMDSYLDFHYLNQADVDIYSRKKFDATATYQYVNSGADTFQILFDALYQVPEDIRKKKTDSITFGESYIDQEAAFYIVPKIIYQGDVKVYANREFLDFDGEIRLDLKHSDEFNDWLPFKYSDDPYEIQIELKNTNPEESDEPLLTTGIHVDGGESEMYYTFLSGKRVDDDPDIFRASGLLSIDPETGIFEIGPKEKIEGKTKDGNFFRYDDSTSIVEFEGTFDLYGYNTPEIDALSYGFGRVNIDSGNYTYNTLTALKYPVPNSAINVIGVDFNESTEFIDNLREAELNSYDLIEKLGFFMGERAAENFDQQLYDAYIPLFSASNKLSKGILFADLDLKWHKEERALYSGDSAGVASIGKNDINARLKTYYEIKKVYEGEVINLFVELLPDCWLYLSYDDGRMAALSSNATFNEIITSKAQDPNQIRDEDEIYMVSADLYEVIDYIKFYNDTYLGKKLKDENINLKVNQPEVEEDKARYNEGGNGDEEEEGWGAGDDEPALDGGWGVEEEPVSDGGWGTPAEPVEEKDDDSGWGYEEEPAIVGAPPANEKDKKSKRNKDKKPKDVPPVDNYEEPSSGWGFGSEPEESNDSGWGFGSEPVEEKPIESKEPLREKKKKPAEEESGWGFGSEPETKTSITPKEEDKPKIKVKEEEEESGWGFGSEPETKTSIKPKDEPKKEEDKPKIKVKDEEESGWGFGSEPETKTSIKPKDEPIKEEEDKPKIKVKEEEESGWGFGSEPETKTSIKPKEEPKKEEDKPKIKVKDEEESGWGFGSEPETKTSIKPKDEPKKEEDKPKIKVKDEEESGWGFGSEPETKTSIKPKEEPKKEDNKKVKEEENKKDKKEDKKNKEEQPPPPPPVEEEEYEGF